MNSSDYPRVIYVITSMLLCNLAFAGPSAIGIREEKVMGQAEKQGLRLANSVLGNNRERFVNYTTEAGVWRTQSDGTWTSGFVPGMFWYLWALTGESSWRDKAMHWTEGTRSRATATDNDTGFQIYCSFGLGYMFDETLRSDYGAVMRQGAKTLVDERYNATIGCFRSWDQNTSNPTSLPFEVNIDQMMNLELILWAGQNGGPAGYVDYAVSHADKTWEHNVREDGGTYHVVAYNLDGTVDYKRTHQGWTTDSTWSRGQAWAVYGYTMVYRYTGLPRMLERARICYDFFINETLKDDFNYVPYSDFDAPLDSRNPRDTSAAAIVAAAAIELFEITGEKAFLTDAEAIMEHLSSPRYFSIGTNYQSLLLAASEKWGRGEVGAIFADYYFLETLWRWNGLEREPGVVTGSWGGYDMLDWRFVDTGSWMGWLSASADPYVYNYKIEGWMYAYPGTQSVTGGWFYRYNP
ncbi:MAG: glycoside hydrolase family 88 protein [Puniceicoccaceae bacterium]